MASTQIDKILNIYKAVSRYPSLTSAKIVGVSEYGLKIQSNWRQRNLESRTFQKFSITNMLKPNLEHVSDGTISADSSELASALTEDGKKNAVLRLNMIENTPKQFIEIWDGIHMLKCYDLSALDVHGDVYTDSEFGSFEWSPNNTKLLYIAEKKLPKTEPFYKQKPLDKKDKDKSEEDPISRGNEYIYKPDWGEQLVGKHRPVVVVLDTNADTITVLPGIAENISPGQVIWTPEGDGIVGVAWLHEPRYLGLMHCSNRESWIFLLKNGEYRNLTENKLSVRSPQFSPNGKHLVWLEREYGGPHHNAHRLMHLKWEKELGKTEILVDVVSNTKTINYGKNFYGLYSRGFPRRGWSNDSSYFFFSTPQRSNVRSYVLNIETKSLTEIENDLSSLSILDVNNNFVLFMKTSLLEPAELMIGRFDENSLGKILKSSITPKRTVDGFENFTYEATEHEYDNGEKIRQFNSMYFGPKCGPDKSHPLLVTVHGGPHSSYCNLFSIEASIFARLGFGVIQVNYRGSTGMGSDTVEYLQGRIGDADVKDCVKAIKDGLQKYPWLDGSRVALSGGSHGGFLVTHLSGQYSDQFRAVATINPVIDVAAMFTISDIPDCRNALTKDEKIIYRHDVCAATLGMRYEDGLPRMDSPEAVGMVVKMFKCSPIVHVDKVKAPTLLGIGKNDLRVPPSQGKHWYHRLKANGVKTKMFVYDENHSLSSIKAEMDEVINAALWITEHTAEKGGLNSVEQVSPSE